MKTLNIFSSKCLRQHFFAKAIGKTVLLILLVCSQHNIHAQILWSTPAGQAWLTAGNWTGSVVPGASDIAQFGTAPTSGVTGVGINMNGVTNNGSSNQAVAAIEVLAARPVGLFVGNSSSTQSGTLTLNGTLVNASNNVILRNGSSSIFEITDFQGFNNIQPLTVALNNNTDNLVLIDGTGGVNISSVISGALKKLTLSGSGNATLQLTAANTYTGLTTVTTNTLRLNKPGGGTLPAGNDILINGGSFKISSDQTISNLTMSSGSLMIDAGATLTITGAYHVTGGTISNSGTIKLNGGPMAFPGTGVTINNGFAGMMTRLEIASSGDITQTLPFGIDNELKLTSGILISNAVNHLTLNPGVLVTGASNTSFIDGPVAKLGSTAFSFPVGKKNAGPSGTVSGIAALEISNFTGTTVQDKFTAEYKRGSAYALGAISAPGLDHISACDYWTLTRDNGTSKVDIRLSWNESINNCVFTSPYVNSLLSLTVAHNDNAGGTWDAYGMNGFTTGNTTSGTVSWAAIQSNSFGAFAIGSIDFMNPLPVAISYFTGSRQNGHHVLNWKINCYGSPISITLERSNDGVHFNPHHTQNATARRCLQPFSFKDSLPAPGVNYYRVKITAVQGKITYGPVLSLINGDEGLAILRISPNPVVNKKFDVQVSSAQNTTFEMLITDLQGRVVYNRRVALLAGLTTIPVHVTGLGAGTYQLSGITATEKMKPQRFVVQ